MALDLVTDKMHKLISETPSKWLEEANWHDENESWPEKSAIIAFHIQRALRSQSISQTKFAEMIKVSPQYVSKILKGKENLTLKTIDSIEKCLGITLQEVIPDNKKNNIFTTATRHQVNE